MAAEAEQALCTRLEQGEDDALAPMPEAGRLAALVATAAREGLARALARLAALDELPALARAEAGQALLRLGHPVPARDALIAALGSEEHLPEWAPWALQAAAWACATPPPRPWPVALEAELSRFRSTLLALLAGAPAQPIAPFLKYTPHTLAWLWLSGIERIDAGSMPQPLRANLRRRLGLSPVFLNQAARGAGAVAEACFAEWPELPFAGDRRIPPRMREVAATVLTGAKPLLCPFTAQRDTTRDSLAAGVFLYRGGPAPCLVLSSNHWVNGWQDAAWIFLEGDVLLLAARPEEAFGPVPDLLRQVAHELALALADAEGLAAWLAAPEREVAIVPLVTAHVGHELWNGLSAWARLFALVEPRRLARVVRHPGLELYPPLAELFPEHAAALAEREVEVEYPDALSGFARQRRALLVTLRDHFIPQHLAERVIHASLARCAPGPRQRIEALRAEADPLLLVTLRLDNRAWAEQEEGLVRVILGLARDFPRLGVVLDGMNRGAETGCTHSLMSLEAELALAARIEAAVGGRVRVENTVGCPLEESIAWCAAVDAYLAPIGAGMAKYRWLANKPGVAFSNEMMLQPGSHDGRLYDNPRFREAPVPAVFVTPEEVRTLEADRHGEAFRANFSMDWRVAWRATRRLLKQLERTGKAAPPNGRA